MEHNSIGRHLLALDDNGVILSLPLTVVGVAALVALVLVLMLCACIKDSKSQQVSSGENSVVKMSDLKSESGSIKRRKDTSVKVKDTSVKNGIAVEATDVTLDMDGNVRHSNGSVPSANGTSRPLTGLDHRALPEIPGTQVSSDLQTDDDEEDQDTESPYDVIAKPSHKDESPKPGPSQRTHPYEKVKSVKKAYAGGGDDVQSDEVSEPGYSGIKTVHPYATVDNVGQDTYAVIEERKDRPPRGGANQVRDDSVSSVPAPPVPDKHFEASESGDDGASTLAAHARTQSGSSPTLPPRNGAASGNSPDSVSEPATDNGGASGGRKEADYIKVTARESIANMRERGVDMSSTPSAFVSPSEDPYESVGYDTVNYDQMRTPGAATAHVISRPVDRSSLTSDLYAEIGSGEQSNRSSTYARVQDFSAAPNPPSVEALKRLTNSADEEACEPGYSRIHRQRPHTMDLSAEPPPAAAASTEVVYAQVNKKKHRMTVHPDSALLSGIQDEEQLYAKVNKQRKQKEEDDDYDEVRLTNTAENTTHVRIGPPQDGATRVRRANGESGYDTIVLEPDYASVQDSLEPCVEDPGYESVQYRQVTHTAMSPGVATEITEATARQWPVLRREHIYSEINETRMEAAEIITTSL